MKTIASEQRRHHELNGPDALEKTKVKFNINNDSNDSPRNNVPALPLTRESLESDTESLVQEKEYQRELQMRIDLLSAGTPNNMMPRRTVKNQSILMFMIVWIWNQDRSKDHMSNWGKTTVGYFPTICETNIIIHSCYQQ